MDTLQTKPARKPRTTKLKTTETAAITPPPKTQPKDTKIQKLKDAQDIFKAQKKIEQQSIKQELKDYAALTRGAAALNRSLAKLENKQNKIKAN
jgi:aspartate oxidase